MPDKEDFLEEMLERHQIVKGNAADEPVPPGLHPQSTLYTIEIAIKGSQVSRFFVLPTRRKQLGTITLVEALDQLHHYALEGIWETFGSWEEDNEDTAKGYGEQAEAFYNYCRKSYKKLRYLLGEEHVSEFIKEWA